MSLIIIEGARASGKTYLISHQNILPVFKFNFNSNFSDWEFHKNGTDIHWFGLGKEVMLHELDLGGHIKDKMLVDRGVLTNSVWGVFQNRITESQAKNDLIKFHKKGLFNTTDIILIEGQYKETRKKDIWDNDDYRINEERSLFLSFSDLLRNLGVRVHTFHNNFDEASIIQFKCEINKI